MQEKNQRLLGLVEDHIHAAHEGRLAPDTPPQAAGVPFPPIEGFSDVKLNLDSQFMRGNRVATRWTIYATHSGPVAGFTPSSMEITITGMTFSWLTDDGTAVARQVSYFDQPALMEQLRMGS
jgi:hypothetical protein